MSLLGKTNGLCLFAGFLEYPLSRHCCFAIPCSAWSIYILYTHNIYSLEI